MPSRQSWRTAPLFDHKSTSEPRCDNCFQKLKNTSSTVINSISCSEKSFIECFTQPINTQVPTTPKRNDFPQKQQATRAKNQCQNRAYIMTNQSPSLLHLKQLVRRQRGARRCEKLLYYVTPWSACARNPAREHLASNWRFSRRER